MVSFSNSSLNFPSKTAFPMNHPAVCVAIVAAAIAFGSLIVAIIGLVIAAKSYKKSKRLEFFQRRDQLFAKISDLTPRILKPT